MGARVMQSAFEQPPCNSMLSAIVWTSTAMRDLDVSGKQLRSKLWLGSIRGVGKTGPKFGGAQFAPLLCGDGANDVVSQRGREESQ